MRFTATIATALSALVTVQSASAQNAPPAETPAETTQVEIVSDNPNATLHQVVAQTVIVTTYGSGVGMMFKQVCRAPCRKTLPRDAEYFIAGPGITGSSRFALPEGERTVLRVDAGSSGARMGGYFLLAGGVGLAMWGILSATLLSKDYDSTSGEYKTDSSKATTGYVLAGAGVLAMVGGIYLMVSSGTRVTTADGMVLARVKTPVGNFRLTPAGTITF